MKRGFSLVELSIVLVILGLLVGGILAGQSLIRASELRSVSTDFNKYQTAIHAFRDKYFGLPGDLRNAFSFWGTLAGCTNAWVKDSAAGCNGNGDSQIAISGYGEEFRAWQHLALAGLIEGSYTGLHTGAEGVIGTNVPASKIGGGFSIGYWNPNNYIGWPATTSRNYLHIGRFFTSELPISAILRPEEAWNLDTKLDDGKPATGRIIGGNGFGSVGCLTGAGTTSEYAISVTTLICGLENAVD